MEERERDLWAEYGRQTNAMERRARNVALVWLAGVVVVDLLGNWGPVPYALFLVSMCLGVWWFAIRPSKRAGKRWEAEFNRLPPVETRGDGPPPMAEVVTLGLYAGHTYKVGDRATFGDHVYEIVAVRGDDVDVVEVQA